MTIALAHVRHSSNYATELSTEEKRVIRFFVSAHMTADEIGNRLRICPQEVRDYCKSVSINVK
jgi:predicted ArsR family transcriptional regulator